MGTLAIKHEKKIVPPLIWSILSIHHIISFLIPHLEVVVGVHLPVQLSVQLGQGSGNQGDGGFEQNGSLSTLPGIGSQEIDFR